MNLEHTTVSLFDDALVNVKKVIFGICLILVFSENYSIFLFAAFTRQTLVWNSDTLQPFFLFITWGKTQCTSCVFVDIRGSFPLTVSRVAEILTGPLKHPVVPVPGLFVRESFHS